MIESLSIQNFESHKKTSLTFSPGVNYIVGLSDHGKSGIIRALRWLIWNRPLGDAFCSHWGGDTKVSLTIPNSTSFNSIDNHITIIREKGTENTYELLGLTDMGARIYKAFNTDIPEEIQKILNINEINSQFQLDRHFLLSASPGEVAQHFNKVAHLNVIDNGLQTIQKWTKQVAQDITAKEGLLLDLEEKIKGYAYLDELEAWIETIEDLEKKQNGLRKNKIKLADTLLGIGNTQEKIIACSKPLQIEKEVNLGLALYLKKNKEQSKKEKLSQILSESAAIQKRSRQLKPIIKLEPAVNKIIELTGKAKTLSKTKTALYNLLAEMKRTQQKTSEAKTNLEKMKKQFNDAMPDICPLCEAPKDWYNQ